MKLLSHMYTPEIFKLPHHTDGAWRAERSADLVGYVVYSRRYGPSDTIAFVEGIWPEQEANARVIAAAPHMKALLIGVMRTPAVPLSVGLVSLIRDVLAECELPLPEHQSGPYKVV